MDAFVKRCEQCNEPLSETTRGRPQKYCSDRCRQAHRKIGVRIGNDLRYRPGRLKPKSALQDSDLSREFEPENPSQKTHLHYERVNEVTFKLTDGEVTNAPSSHGKWAGYRSTKALAWVIKIGADAWLARCENQAYGPSTFIEAKQNAVAMARGAVGNYVVDNSIAHLNGLQALLSNGDGGAANA